MKNKLTVSAKKAQLILKEDGGVLIVERDKDGLILKTTDMRTLVDMFNGRDNLTISIQSDSEID